MLSQSMNGDSDGGRDPRQPMAESPFPYVSCAHIRLSGIHFYISTASGLIPLLSRTGKQVSFCGFVILFFVPQYTPTIYGAVHPACNEQRR